jgi:hypothetical protein
MMFSLRGGGGPEKSMPYAPLDNCYPSLSKR